MSEKRTQHIVTESAEETKSTEFAEGAENQEAFEEVIEYADVENGNRKSKNKESKKSRNIFEKFLHMISSIRAKILIPFVLATIIISLIGVYLLYVSSNTLADSMIAVKLIDTMEMYNDYELKYVDDYSPWIESNDVFYHDWESDVYSQEFLHDSEFGFAVFEYNKATGIYDMTTDLDSGVSRVLASATFLSKANCDQLNEDCNFYHTSSEIKEGVLNKYYWLFVAQDVTTVRPSAKRKAFAVVYNVTESIATMRSFYIQEILYMLFPAFVFTVIIGLVIGKVTRRIHYVSNYVNNIDFENLPEAPLNLRAHDELREMADSVNKMVTGLKERERMSHELSTAASIQSNMLISHFPAFPDRHDFDIYATMTPAKEVGGDFYDMYMIDDKRLAIVIGDVSDKGVPAALFMAMTKSLIKYHLPSGDTDEVLGSVNQFLYEGNEKFMFVTCFIGILNLETGELEYASAGHNPPAIKLGKDGDYQFLDVEKDLVLGLMPNVTYNSKKIIIPHGSKIVLYTDGVTEAINNEKMQYEEHRLIDCLKANDNNPVSDVLNAVNEDIARFRGEEAQFDDITMLMVEYY